MRWILLVEFRRAVALLKRQPGFAALLIANVALAIAVNTAVFSAVHPVVIQPLAYRDSDRLVAFYESRTGYATIGVVAPADFAFWRQRTRTFQDLAGYDHADVTFQAGADAIRVHAAEVSHAYFRVFGVTPILGRVFIPADEISETAAVISERLWRSQCGSDPHILNRTVNLNGTAFRVVGVVPGSFDPPHKAVIWLAARFPQDDAVSHYLRVVGKLKPGVTLTAAQTEMTALTRRLQLSRPDTNKGRGVQLLSLRASLYGSVLESLFLLWAAVLLVLLIASANVAILLLGRAEITQQECATRLALGAGHLRLVGEVLGANLIIAAVGAIIGAVVGLGLVGGLRPFAPAVIRDAVNPSWSVLAVSAALFIATMLAAIVPVALKVMSMGPATVLRATRHGSSLRFRGSLVCCEVALAVLLVATGTAMLGELVRLLRTEPGFAERSVAAIDVDLPSQLATEDPSRCIRFVQHTREELAAHPEFAASAVVSVLPLERGLSRRFEISGRQAVSIAERPSAEYRVVTQDYFKTLEIPILAGRDFTDADRYNSPRVVMINEAMRRQFWPSGSAIGARLRWSGSDNWASVVGIVASVRQLSLKRPPLPEMYVPFGQDPLATMTLLVRARGQGSEPSEHTLQRVLQGAAAVARGPVAPSNFRRLSDVLAASTAIDRFSTALVSIFASLCLVLALTGVYGVLGYLVNRGRREFGIRLAVGARPSSLVSLVVGTALQWSAIGSVLAILGFAMVRTAAPALTTASILPNLRVLVTTIVSVNVAAVLASVVPALRAARTDPVTSLRIG